MIYEIWYNGGADPKLAMCISRKVYKGYEKASYVRSNLGFKVGIAVSLKEKA